MNKYSLTFFTILFAAGITAADRINASNGLLFGLWAVLLFFASAIYFFFKPDKPRTILLNLLIAVNILLFGIVYSSLRAPSEGILLPSANNECILYGVVTEARLPAKDYSAFIIKCDSLIFADRIIRVKINAACISRERSKNILPGSVVKARGKIKKPEGARNPGEFDQEKYYSSLGMEALFTVQEIVEIKHNPEANIFSGLIYNIRNKIDYVITSLHNDQTSALLRALILGERNLMDKDDINSFKNAGIVHVLAVSGLHVGIIASFFYFLFGRFNRKLRLLLLFPALGIFALISGGNPPVMRAVIMAYVFILSALFNRKYFGIHALAFSALIILLINPGSLFQPGFIFSFSAAAGIIIIYPPLVKIAGKYLHKQTFILYAVKMILITFSAQVFLFPFLMKYANFFAPVSFIANLVMVPLTALILVTAVFTLMFSFLPILPEVFSAANNVYAWLFFYSGHIFGAPDFINYTDVFTDLDVFLYLAFFIITVILYYKSSNVKVKTAASLLILINFIVFSSLDNNKLLPEGKLSVLFIDVGQGDCILLRFPDGKTALIDAGREFASYNSGEKVIYPLLRRLNINCIDYLFLSHLDSDHSGGVKYLVENITINQVIKPAPYGDVAPDQEIENLFLSKGINFSYYNGPFENSGNVRLYFLNDVFYYSGDNNKSGVIKVVFGGTSFLFTGDIDLAKESSLADRYGGFLTANVVKASHHGSGNGTGNRLLQTAKPEKVVISCGENNYGHPSEEALTRIRQAGADIYRTDLSGAILFVSDGKTIKNVKWK